MNKKHWLKCPRCGNELTMQQAYTGCDWDTEVGEGSDYNYEISLDCRSDKGCGNIYPLGNIKNSGDFSVITEWRRSFNKGNM